MVIFQLLFEICIDRSSGLATAGDGTDNEGSARGSVTSNEDVSRELWLLRLDEAHGEEDDIDLNDLYITCNKWVNRYLLEGISGLETRKGRGRKPIMDCSDEEAVRKAIENDRQSVNKAREAWQNAVGKEASESTFKRFLSALAQDISE